jgi:hypothetical protein
VTGGAFQRFKVHAEGIELRALTVEGDGAKGQHRMWSRDRTIGLDVDGDVGFAHDGIVAHRGAALNAETTR